MHSNSELEGRIASLEEEIGQKKKQLATLRKQLPWPEVKDYALRSHDGTEVMLSSLFGDQNDLIVIHNMGKGCAYCTLWADGFNGFVQHLENRAAFVLVSPDDHETQKKFAESRGWKFKMLSGRGTSFIRDMGFESGERDFMPGVSTFHRNNDGKIFRVAKAEFGPGDDYCGIWHLFELLPDGGEKWRPKYSY